MRRGNRRAALALLLAAVFSASSEIGWAQPQNLARNCPYTMTPRPNYSLTTDAGDDRQLTDGAYTNWNPIWLKPSTVGWSNASPVTIVIDLRSVQAVSGVSYSTAAGKAAVEWPRSIFVLVSDDGQHYFPVADLAAIPPGRAAPPPAGYSAFRYIAADLDTHARYVALIIDQNGPYVFSDEIEVLAGDPARVGSPLSGESTTDLQDFFVRAHMRVSIQRRLTIDLQDARAALATSPAPASLAGQLSHDLDVLQAEIATLSGPDPAVFTTIMPLNDLHARIFAVHGAIARADGFPPLTAWPANPWDFVRPLDKPPIAAARDAVSIVAMNGETRAGAITVSSSTDQPMIVSVNIAALSVDPAEPDLHPFEVVWTDTRELIPVADALVPLAGGSPTVALPAGMTRQIWLTFSPRRRPPGSYRGYVELAADGIAPVRVPIELTVPAGTFPVRSALHLGGWDYTNTTNVLGLTANNTAPLVDQLRALGVDSPWATNAVLPPGRFDAAGRLSEPPQTSRFDNWIARWPDASAYFVFVNAQNTLGNVSSVESTRFSTALGEWITFWVQHAASAGIAPARLVLLLVDEPHSTDQDDRVVRWTHAIKAAAPAVRIWEDPTYPDPAASQPLLLDVVDVLAIKTWLMVQQGPAFADFYRRRGKQGQELAIYGASGPARLVDPYTYQRLQAWTCADMGATSSFFWSFSDDAGGRSWNEYATTKAPYSPFFLADDQITTTKHAEAIREGTEDFEYVAMLQRRVKALEQSDSGRPGLSQAAAFLDRAVATVLQSPGATDVQWASDKDRSAAERMRLAIAATLARLDSGGGDASIGRAAPSVRVIGGTFAYDGQPHPAVATATGAYGVPVPGSYVFTYTPGGSAPPVYGGVYSVTAQFTSSDPEYADAREGDTITVLETTTTSVGASSSSSVFGEAVTFAATVAGAGSTPPGSVQFAVDGEPTGAAVMLQDGVATLTIRSLTPGRHAIRADYSGSAGFSAGAGAIEYDVAPATPLVAIESITVAYDGSAHALTAAATGRGGAPVPGSFTMTYEPGGSSAPVNPGTYSATVVFRSSDPNYADTSASAAITVYPNDSGREQPRRHQTIHGRKQKPAKVPLRP